MGTRFVFLVSITHARLTWVWVLFCFLKELKVGNRTGLLIFCFLIKKNKLLLLLLLFLV